MHSREIFLTAIEIADLQERMDYVARTCGNNQPLYRQVQALLAAHERSGEFLDIPAMEQVAGAHSRSNKASLDQQSIDEIDLSFLQLSSRPDSLGRLLHYEVLELVGRGGCGIVLKAFDEKLHRVVAIKTMTPELAVTSPARKRFLREARATAAIRHENVVSIYAVEEKPLPFLVMEFIDGQTLQDKISESGPLDVHDLVSIGRQIARGLEAAHVRGLIHRDIKPANILLESGTGQPKITDFGLARSADDASLTQSGAISGTPLYMSPEQAQGLVVDQRSDLFSLGSVLYVMCSGRPPFRASTAVAVLKRVVEEQPRPIQDIIPDVPDWLVAMIARLHAKQPHERFSSAQEIVELLDRGEWVLRRDESAGGATLLADVKKKSITRWRYWETIIGAFVTVMGLWVYNVWINASTSDSKQTPIPVPTEQSSLPKNRQLKALAIPVFRRDPVHVGSGDFLGDYRLENGEFIQAKTGHSKIIFGDPDWDDFDLSLEVMTLSGSESGHLMFRCSKNGGHDNYILYLKNKNGLAAIYRSDKGYKTEVAPPVDLAAVHHRWYKVDVSTRGSHIAISVDGRRLFDFEDDGRRQGYVGLTTFGASIKWRNLTLKDAEGNLLWEGFPDINAISFSHQASPDRLAAEYVLSVGGDVHIEGVSEPIRVRHKLPQGPFKLTECYLMHRQPISDEGMRVFEGTRHIKKFDTNSPAVSDVGAEFLRNNSQLEVLGLTSARLTKKSLACFRDCSKLWSIWLSDTNVTDNDIEALKSCKGLIWLGLSRTRVTDAGLKYFHNNSKLYQLDLESTTLTDDGMLQLLPFTSLGALSLNKTDIGDRGLEHLQKMTFHYLHLNDTKVTDDGLGHLAGQSQLKQLNLLGTAVTKAGIESLSRSLPKCQIQWDGGKMTNGVSERASDTK